MKLLVVCQYYFPEPFAVADVCEELVRRGHSVTVLTGLPNYPEGSVPPEYRHGQRRHECHNGVEIWRTFEVGRGAGVVRRLANYVSFVVSGSARARRLAHDFDAVLVYQLSPVTMAIPGLTYARKHRTPVIIYCLDLWPASLLAWGVRSSSVLYRLVGVLSRAVYRSAQIVLVTSESFRQYLIDEQRVEPSRIRHLPQYAEDASAGSSSTAELPEAAISRVADVNLVFCGNVGQLQSVDTIVRAAQILGPESGYAFHIVGDGSGLPECRNLATELGASNVIFHGRRPVEEMPAWYAFADALLVTMQDVPELAMTLPRKVQSYMAAGRPIVAAIGGEAGRVIEESGGGICCAPERPEMLAEACVALREMDLESLGRRSQSYYQRHFEREHFFTRLLIEIESLAARGPAGAAR